MKFTAICAAAALMFVQASAWDFEEGGNRLLADKKGDPQANS